MLNQIISGTPVYVWAILAFLMLRGIKAAADRELTIRAVVIIPLVMLGLSIQGILSGFGAEPLVLTSWAVAMLAGATLSWNAVNQNNVRILAEKNMVFYRGSWGPMILMMSIFIMKYIVNVALHVAPALHTNLMFAVISTALFGICNGLFLGKMLRVLLMFQQAKTTTPALAM